MKYLIRSLKYLVYFFIVFVLLVGIIYMATKSDGVTLDNMFKEGSWIKITIMFIVIAAIYPYFGFKKMTARVEGDFSKHIDSVIEMLKNFDYSVENQDINGIITFRHNRKAARLSRMMEDRITVDYSGDTVTVEGLRRDITRIVYAIETATRKEE